MNVLVCLNRNIVYQLIVLLESLFTKNNSNEQMHIYVFNTDFLPSDKTIVEKYIQEKGQQVSIIDVEEDILKVFDPNGRIPLESYLRLVAVDFLPKEIDRIIYLDVDIIVNKNIAQFYNEDFEGKMICAMPIISPKVSYEEWLKSYDKAVHTFFNAGVLLINLKEWRSQKYTVSKFAEIYSDICKRLKKAPPYQDQSVLNEAFGSNVKLLDNKLYNHRAAQSLDIDRFINDKYYASIIHYTNDLGTQKPWVYKFDDKTYIYYSLSSSDEVNQNIHIMHKIWWNFAAKTPYYGQLYDEAIIRTREYLKHAPKLKEGISQRKQIANISADRDKWRTYSTTFKSMMDNNLLTLDEDGKIFLENAFLAKGHKRIAIYGDTEITKVLCKVLGGGTTVSIEYIVEDSKKPVKGFKTVDRNPADYPDCDVMLIGDIFRYKEIEAKLKKLQVPFPFYNAAEYIKSLPAGSSDGALKIKNKIEMLNGKVATYAAKYRRTEGELQSIKNSLSFRVGRMITFFPRKLRDTFKRKK